MDRPQLERTMHRRWADAGNPPWGTLTGDPVEEAKARLLAPHLDAVRAVLDCGCGGGDFLALVDPERRLEYAVGVDVAERAIERARRTGRYAHLVCGHVEDLAPGSFTLFDLVLFSEMLYYIRDYRLALGQTIDTFLTPGGSVFVSVAVGRSYFGQRDLDAIRGVFTARGLQPVFDRRIDYLTSLRLPRRWFWRWFGQETKQIMLYRRAAP
jgi:SAM-dependent methyltransferase